MPRILLVDDSPVELRSAERLILKSLPESKVMTAATGAGAMELLDHGAMDVVVTDLNMPGMSGLDLVLAIGEKHPQVPVVLMTGFGSEEIAISALSAGAASYVPKSVLKTHLVPTLVNVLALSQTKCAQQRLLANQVRSEATFVIENDTALVGPLVRLIQEQVVRIQAAADRDVTRIGVALHEAILNAIYHGNLEVSSDLRQDDESIFHMVANERRKLSPYKLRRVKIMAEISPEETRITIRDEGPGYDTKKAMDPNREIDLERIGGRGLLLIASFMDVVYHNATGNEIHLIKYGPISRMKPGNGTVPAEFCQSQELASAPG